MRLTIQKMDKRHKGADRFIYMVEWYDNGKTENISLIRDMRQWCWEQFGPSCEYYEYDCIAKGGLYVNPRWCWIASGRILLANEEDRNWFAMRWS